MEIVYTSLHRRHPAVAPAPGEAAEVLGAVWAHALPDDGLQHVSARSEDNRIDLLLYLLTSDPDTPGTHCPLQRATALIARSHQASPSLRHQFLLPDPSA
ncbi:hypothetical protein ACFQ0T_21725 [Kitasatospora gansuensis]